MSRYSYTNEDYLREQLERAERAAAEVERQAQEERALYGYEQLTEEGRELARKRGQNPYPVCDCWDCGELRPDDLDPCPTCGAECVPF